MAQHTIAVMEGDQTAQERLKRMTNKRTTGLAELVDKPFLVEIDRAPVDEYTSVGYLVGISEKLILLHLLQDQVMRLNGYVAVRHSDVKGYRVYDRDKHFISRVLPLLGEKPLPQTDLDITSVRSLLATASIQFSVIGIQCEKIWPDSLFIGVAEKLSSKAVLMRNLNGAGGWDAPEEFLLKNITKVVLGDGYQESLAFLVQQEASAAGQGENS